MIVVDASVALELALATPELASFKERILASDEGFAAPELLDLEVAQALRRMVRQKTADENRAAIALEQLRILPIERVSHAFVIEKVWALRANLTAYDAAYFALAEMLDAPLWTRDRKFLAATNRSPRIEIV